MTFAETAPTSPPSIMAGTGQTITYGELDERANRLAQLFRSLGLQPGRPRRLLHGEPPRFLEVAWGCHYAGLVLHRRVDPADRRRAAYIVNDCGARVVHHVARTSPTLAAGTVADTPKVEARLMVDGTVDGYESYEDAVAARPAEPADRPGRGRRHALQLGHHRPAQGREAAAAEAAARRPSRRCTAAGQMLFGFDEDSVYLSPAPLYHAAPLRFMHGRPPVRRHRRGHGALRPRGGPAADRGAPASPTRQWVPTMFIRMLKLPDEVRRAYDVSSLQMWSTPPRRARSR